MSVISKELAALDAVIEGGMALASEAMARKADLKQGKLASELFGNINKAVKIRLESRINQGRLIEIEAKLLDDRNDQNNALNPATVKSVEQQPAAGANVA